MAQEELHLLSRRSAAAAGVDEISPVELASLLAAAPDRVLLLDARTVQEQSVSRLAGAIAVDPEAAAASIAELRRFIGAPDTLRRSVVVYCAAGARSARLAGQIKAYLPTNANIVALNLQGGLFAWAAAGLPLVDDAGKATRRVHGYSPQWSRLALPPAEVTLEPVIH